MADVSIVPNAGMAIISDRLKGVGDEPNHCAWGLGTTPPAVGDTALESEQAETRIEGTSSQQTTNTTDDTYRVVAELTCETVAKAITEAGLFDAVTSGNLLCRSTFSAINVSVGDKIEFTIDVVFDQAA